MLTLLLTCVVVTQNPQALLTAAGASVQAVAVRGEPELSQAAAFQSARSRAEGQLLDRWRERATTILVQQRPFWMPAQLAEHAADRWLGRMASAEILQVVDREDRSREHEFGTSYQTTLWIAEDDRQVVRGQRQLRAELDRVVQRTLITSGGTVAFWALLALAIGWLDRLSRGYMTGRLRLAGLLLGTIIPTVAFML